MKRFHILIVITTALLSCPVLCLAQWTPDLREGAVKICQEPGYQTYNRVLNLVNGKTLIGWATTGGEYTVKYQIVNQRGEPLLEADGIQFIDSEYETVWTNSGFLPDGQGERLLL